MTTTSSFAAASRACIAILGAALLFGVLPRRSRAQTAEMLGEPVAPVRLADDVYYVGTRGISIFLFATTHGHLLMNAGFEIPVPLVEWSMASLGYSIRDVKLVLVGHAHPDHVAGLRLLQQRSRARVIVGGRDARAVTEGSRDAADHWPGARVARRVVEGEIVRFGGWRFTAHSTPGHTPGCTTWTTTIRVRGRPLAAQFLCSTSVPGNTRLVNNAEYPGIARDYAATFRKLDRMPCTTFFHEHPQGFRLERKVRALREHPDEYPFTDPAGCRANLAEDVATFKAMLAKQSASAAPVAGHPTAVQPAPARRARWRPSSGCNGGSKGRRPGRSSRGLSWRKKGDIRSLHIPYESQPQRLRQSAYDSRMVRVCGSGVLAEGAHQNAVSRLHLGDIRQWIQHERQPSSHDPQREV